MTPAETIYRLQLALIAATTGELRGPHVTVAEAAGLAGTTDKAIRRRIARGTLVAEPGPRGRVLIRTGELALSAATRPFTDAG